MMDLELRKTMPHDLNLEESILGAIMLDRNAAMIAFEILRPSDFYLQTHEKAAQAMYDISVSGLRVDMLTVQQQLRTMGMLDSVGGISFIISLTDKVASSANLEAWCHILKDKSIKRSLIRSYTEAVRGCFEDIEYGVEICNFVDSVNMEIKQSIMVNSETKEDVASRALKEMTTPATFKGLPMTSIPELNKMTNGMRDGDLIILAARPSMGKSMLANTIMLELCKQGKKGLFWGLEMTNEQMLNRFISAHANVNFDDIEKGRVDPTDTILMNKIDAAIQEYKSDKINMYDKSGVSAIDVRSAGFTLNQRHGLDYIIVDHGGLMKSIGDKNQSTSDKIGNSTRLLKQTAKDLGIPIILLWQLNRNVIHRGGEKRPGLSDLRGSGNIEEDADKVLFVHRPSYYGSGEMPENYAEIIIAKCRNGKCGVVEMTFDWQFAQFYQWDNDLEFTKPTAEPDQFNKMKIRGDASDVPF